MKLGVGFGYNMSLICALGFLFLAQTCEQTCLPHICPPGYFRRTNCGPNDTFHLCEPCPLGYYTKINNTISKCIQCKLCGRNTEEKTQCTTISDVECICKKGYYKKNKKDENCNSCQGEDCKKGECKKYAECQQTLGPSSTTPTTTLTMTSTTTTERQNHTTATTGDSSPGLNHIVWVFLLLLMLPVMVIRNLYKYLHLCPRWRVKQDMETSIQNNRDPDCLQSPTTLAFTISEETPMMEVMSPAPPERPAQTSPLLPNGETRVSPDLSEPWPAIVLYTVINEVPLRRWKEFLRLLSVADQQLERVELDAGLNSMERQYQMLRLWSQMSSANMDKIYSALHYMELSGCAQMLKESLEKLQWRPPGVTV